MKIKELATYLLFYLAFIMVSCSSDRMSREDFMGTWVIVNASAKIGNSPKVEPKRSELGKITFEEGKVISEGHYGIISSGKLGYLSESPIWAGWEFNEKTMQIKINGFLWTLTKVYNTIEFFAVEEDYGNGFEEYHFDLSREE